eukprot:jgi/Astpho2/9860/e_gw1.00151.19.1_t
MQAVGSTYAPGWWLKLTNVTAYSVVILVNVASGQGWLGASNADVSSRFQTPLTPKSWAFSIWGLIFTLQGLGVIYTLIPWGYASGGWKERVINTIGYSWAACWLFEGAWQLCFILETPLGMWLSLAMLLGALTSIWYALAKLYR